MAKIPVMVGLFALTALLGIVFRTIHRFSPPATALARTRSSSDGVQVLASRRRVLLVNRCSTRVRVELSGRAPHLGRYEVRSEPVG